MCKNLISLSMAVTLLLCPACQISHAANNEETARKIAAIFAEEEEKAQQKLNLESSKRQMLENENKALLEELQKLKAEKENKAVLEEMQKLKAEKNNKEWQQEIEKLKKQKVVSKQKSIWSVKDLLRGVCSVGGALVAWLAAVFGIAGIGAGAQSAYQCSRDADCSWKSSEKTCTDGRSIFGNPKVVPCNTWPDKFKAVFSRWFKL